MFFEKLCCYAVAFGDRSGKAAVIDGTAAAGGAAFLQKGGFAAVFLRCFQRNVCAAGKLCCNVRAAFGKNALARPFRGRARRGKPAVPLESDIPFIGRPRRTT